MGQDDGLFEAVRSSHLSEVKELLEKGANPNARDEEGFTPLHYASFNGCASVAKLLLDSGADPNVGSKEGWTPPPLGCKQRLHRYC
jgi:ankyrin repeat protein